MLWLLLVEKENGYTFIGECGCTEIEMSELRAVMRYCGGEVQDGSGAFLDGEVGEVGAYGGDKTHKSCRIDA